MLLRLLLGCDNNQRYKRGAHMDRLTDLRTHRVTNTQTGNHRDRWMFWQTNTWIEERTDRHANTQRDRQSQWLLELLLLLEFLVRAKNFQFFQRKISNFFNLPLFLFSGFSPDFVNLDRYYKISKKFENFQKVGRYNWRSPIFWRSPTFERFL